MISHSLSKSLQSSIFLSLDTETTGLRWYHGHTPFLLAIGDDQEQQVFDCKALPSCVIDKLLCPNTVWFIHNATFDLHMLEQLGIRLGGTVIDTITSCRLAYSDHHDYTLEACGERIGVAKDKAVEEYISKHRLYVKTRIYGKKKELVDKQFHLVPMDLLIPYAKKDVEVCFKVGMNSLEDIEKIDQKRLKNHLPLTNVLENEIKVTRVLVDMESRGILLDREYCELAQKHCIAEIEKAALEWKMLTGKELNDSNKEIKEYYHSLGFKGRWEQDKDGKWSEKFDEETLESIDHVSAPILLRHRKNTKLLGSFFSTFLLLQAPNGSIHANNRQSGTRTGRISCNSPNLQQLKSDSYGEVYPVRKAFIARKGFLLVSIDFQAQEYRLLADQAGETFVINKILSGDDIHQATAILVVCERTTAKVVGFCSLYGGGYKRIAKILKISLEMAKDIRNRFFDKLRKISNFISVSSEVAAKRGWVKSWSGRVHIFSDRSKAYRATNRIIQGGCADITKIAMVKCHSYLDGKLSKLLLSIHDELVFEVHESELDIIPELGKLMISAYPPIKLPMDVGIEIGKNLHDLVDYKEFLKSNVVNGKERDIRECV